MKKEVITHPGFVKELSSNSAKISIAVSTGCASCQVKGACNVGEMDEKLIEIPLSSGQTLSLGQQVVIEMKQSLGTWAVLFGYIFPFLVVLLSLIILTSMDIEEGIAGLISLGLLLPYYLALYALKGSMKKHFSYQIQI